MPRYKVLESEPPGRQKKYADLRSTSVTIKDKVTGAQQVADRPWKQYAVRYVPIISGSRTRDIVRPSAAGGWPSMADPELTGNRNALTLRQPTLAVNRAIRRTLTGIKWPRSPFYGG